MRLILLILPMIATAAAASAPPRLLAAEDRWAAIDRGSRCEAVSRAVHTAARGQDQARVAILFDRSGRRQNQLSVRLRRPARAGSSAVLTIGTQPFMLATRGAQAWSGGRAQDMAIDRALRANAHMRVEARDEAGRRMIDYYELRGAPTAIDAAAAACSRRQ